ncbi:MAG: class I SAM-dependent methyltransferase [Candidatus Heimdallarchaeota archaeon]|nr:MAG: class I SAM-dependent methyltransferase [Candidatus Heimdallarchaeota archaeon]
MNNKDIKEHISQIFTRAASTYDQVGFRFFSYFGNRLVELTRIPQNAKVLDVATGRGASLFPAIKRVGFEGTVVGIDIAEGMVKETEMEIKNKGISNVKVVQMDAENLTYQDNTFDFVLCGLSIFFFPHYTHALREALRVLKPGGQIGISTFFHKSHDELKWLGPLFQKYISSMKEEKKLEKDTKEPEFDTVEGMQKILIAAGFKDFHHEIEEKEFVCQNAEEFWEFLWSIYTRNTLERIPSSRLVELKEEIKRNFIEHSQDNVLYITVRVLFTFGRK